MKQRKHAKKNAPEPAPTRFSRLGNLAFAAFSVIAAVVVVIALEHRPGEETPFEPQPNDRPDAQRTLVPVDAGATNGPTAAEQRVADEMHPVIMSAIVEAAGTDPEALQLVDYYRRCAFYALPRSGGNMVIFPRADLVRTGDPCVVPILISTQDEVQVRLGVNAESKWMFLEELHALLLPPNMAEYSRIWAGAIVLHELYHAHEHFVTRAARTMGTDPMAPEHVAEEIHAHQLEDRLLNGWTHGSYARAIHALRVAMRAEDPPPGSWFGGIHPQHFPIVDSLFPPAADDIEKSVRVGQYALSVDFLIVEERGLGDEGRQSVYRAISAPMFGL